MLIPAWPGSESACRLNVDAVLPLDDRVGGAFVGKAIPGPASFLTVSGVGVKEPQHLCRGRNVCRVAPVAAAGPGMAASGHCQQAQAGLS